jgi:hypothetical protein
LVFKTVSITVALHADLPRLYAGFFFSDLIDRCETIEGDAIKQPPRAMNSTNSEESVMPDGEPVLPGEESEMLPQIGDKIRLAEDDGACRTGDEGRVLDVLPNGKLIVVCNKDKDCNAKGPFRCTVRNWEQPECKGTRK